MKISIRERMLKAISQTLTSENRKLHRNVTVEEKPFYSRATVSNETYDLENIMLKNRCTLSYHKNTPSKHKKIRVLKK